MNQGKTPKYFEWWGGGGGGGSSPMSFELELLVFLQYVCATCKLYVST